MTGSNWVHPPLIVNASGRPRPSYARWILVLSPPRGAAERLASPGPPFSGPGGVLVGPHDRRFDVHDRPVDLADRVCVLLDMDQQPVPGSIR